VDSQGNRHRKNFTLKRDADTERVRIEGQIQTGNHVPDRASRTVQEGCYAWLDEFELKVRAGKRARATYAKYRSHLDCHLQGRPLAKVLLTRLRPADVEAFAADLQLALSDHMARKALKTVKMALSWCRRREWLASSPGDGIRIEGDGDEEGRVEIPPKVDLKALVDAAAKADDHGRSLSMVLLMLYCGLRMGELRGLPRGALVLHGAHPNLTVSQAADQYGSIKAPKTRAGRRRVPLGPRAVGALKDWLKHAPVSDLHLVFPTGAGTVESHANVYHRWWVPLMKTAGLVAATGKPIFTPHTLRHAAASLWIEQGLMPKRVQHLMGHASLQMTMDLYGHLWTDPADDNRIAAAMERQLG
jgi:integrase